MLLAAECHTGASPAPLCRVLGFQTPTQHWSLSSAVHLGKACCAHDVRTGLIWKQSCFQGDTDPQELASSGLIYWDSFNLQGAANAQSPEPRDVQANGTQKGRLPFSFLFFLIFFPFLFSW